MPDTMTHAARIADSIILHAPHYIVGQDAAGHWLAVETHGSSGGIFVTRDAALHYALGETSRRPGAIDFVERLAGFLS